MTPPPAPSPLLRWMLFLLGWVFVALGLVGAVLPVVPTTPFLLLALWAFARSSRRFHRWLLAHPLLGPPLADWETHRVIPVRAKVLAVTGMAAGMAWVVFGSSAPWYAAAAMGAVCAYGSWFVLSRPSSSNARTHSSGGSPHGDGSSA